MLSSVGKLVAWLLTGFLAILTIFFNMYLLLVTHRSYRKKHKLNPADFIITFIALASISQQVLTYLWQTIDVIDTVCRISLMAAILLVLIFSLKLIIFWSTAFLTFYYGTKLVMEPVHCYTRIQEAIVKHVHTALALIFVSGFANCVPLLSVITYYNGTEFGDCGSIMPTDTTGLAYVFYYVIISDILPGIVMVKCSISISYHLAKHLLEMKASSNGAHGPKLGTQMRVIKMTLSLVVVYICFVAVDIYTQMTVVLMRQNTLALTILFASVYTTVSAFVLVYGKKSYWKELIASYNLFLEEYPCFSGMKVEEVKTEPHEHSHGH
ncbi:taste receptor, type 2, member 202 [Siphateles boraxobius]|uniref:taste receptor, type 2, member 202 n=1 Tax=Siphateles boraxobius TaxID=180520 RepID=UPI0040642C17